MSEQTERTVTVEVRASTGEVRATFLGGWVETPGGWRMDLSPTDTAELSPGVYSATMAHPRDEGVMVGKLIQVPDPAWRPVVNHADLLRRYIAHVRACEGVAFLYDDQRWESADGWGITFTDDEWAILCSLERNDT